MKNQTKITIIITALLVILLGGYIYKDISSKQINNDGTIISTSTQKTVGDSLENDDVIVDIKPIEEKKLPSLPNLNKAIVFNIEISNEDRVIKTNKINEIIKNLKKDPDSLDDWVSLGANRKQIGDFEGAVEAWEYATKISPLNIVPLNNLGNLYHYQLKDYAKAEDYFRKAISISPNYLSPYMNLFDLYTLSYKQETDNAEKILLEGLENNPNHINLLMILSTYYRDNNRNEEAVTYYKKTAEQAKELKNLSLYDQIQAEISSLENS